MVFPHEICPVDGAVVDGHGTMDESVSHRRTLPNVQSAGSALVLSGAVNGETALIIRCEKLPQRIHATLKSCR